MSRRETGGERGREEGQVYPGRVDSKPEMLRLSRSGSHWVAAQL